MNNIFLCCLLIGCSSSDGNPEKPAHGETGQPTISDSGEPSDDETWEPWNERLSLSLSGTVVKYLERTPISENACIEVYDRGSTFTGMPEMLAHTEVRSDGSWETEETEFKTQIGPLLIVTFCDPEAGGEFSPSSIQIPRESFRESDGETIDGLIIEAISDQYLQDIEASLYAFDRDFFAPSDEGLFGRILDPSNTPVQAASIYCIDGHCPVFYHAEGADDNDYFRNETGEALEKTSSEGRYVMPGSLNNTYGVTSEDWDYDNLTSGGLYGVWHLQNYFPVDTGTDTDGDKSSE